MKKIFSFLGLVLLICLFANAQSKSEPDLKSIYVNGDKIHYIDVGKGDPIVFIHGAVGDYRTFSKQINDFSRNHRVISYSRRFAFPNQQTITDSSKLSVESHAADLTAFLKALNTGPVNLFGHSYGADIAIITAMNNPELVNKLILGEPFLPSMLSGIPGGDTILNNFFAKAFVPIIEAFKSNDDAQALNLLVTGVMGDSSYYHNKLTQADRDNMMNNITELKSILLGNDNFPSVSCDDVKKIKSPVLLVKGDISPRVFSLMSDELKKCLSNSIVATLTNTSHGLEYENPAEFNKIVLAFIDKK